MNRRLHDSLCCLPARGRFAVWLQRLAAAAVSLSLSACALPAGSAGGPARAELGSAPEMARIGGRAFRLEVYLWRDYMPISPPDGRPLSVVLRVISADGRPLPSDLGADRFWVLKGDEVWSAAVGEPRAGDPSRPDRREYVARGGPKWLPGERVDVVVRLTDGAGTSYLLRAAGQPIERTS